MKIMLLIGRDSIRALLHHRLLLGLMLASLALTTTFSIFFSQTFFAGNGLYSQSNPLYLILPSYSDFNLIKQIFWGTLMTASDVGYLSLYAADVVGIMLLLAMWRFSTKELV